MFKKEILIPFLLFALVTWGLPNLDKIVPLGPTIKVTLPLNGTGVLTFEESDVATRKTLTQEQLNVLLSEAPGSFRDWCKNHAPNGFFLIDDDSDLSLMPKWVQELRKEFDKAENKSLPFMFIVNGKSGYAGAVPKDTQSAIETAKKYEVK